MNTGSRGRRAAITLLIASTLLAGLLPAAASAARGEPIGPASAADPLASIMEPDGTLAADLGPDRTIDATGWALKARAGDGRARFVRSAGRPKKARTNAVVPAGTAGTTSWASLASGAGGDGIVNGHVHAMAVYKGELIVGGSYLPLYGIGGAPAYLARWNGNRWLGLGPSSSFPSPGPIAGAVHALAVFKDELYVGGSFYDAAGIARADRLARWNGSTWRAVGDDGSGGPAITNGLNSGTGVWAMAATPSNLYIGGSFRNAGGVASADFLVRWNGTAYSSVGNVAGDGVFTSEVYAITIKNSNVYVGGLFIDASGNPFSDHLARWTGEQWLPVHAVAGNGPINCSVLTMLWVGSDLYIGGCFTDVRALPCADYITVFNGGDFECLGNTAGNGVLSGAVHSLLNLNGNVVMGGAFQNAAGNPRADHLATWNPQTETWSTFGSDGTGDGALEAVGLSLAEYQGRLYVGSPTYNIAGIPQADGIASWGTSARRRPDAWVRVTTEATDLGDGIYQPVGTWQERFAWAWVGERATFRLTFQNDGGAAARLRIKGAGPTSKVGVVYKRGTTNVTAAVVAGTYVTPKLAPGATHVLTATMTAKPAFGVPGTKVSLLVTASTTTTPTISDGIRMALRYNQ